MTGFVERQFREIAAGGATAILRKTFQFAVYVIAVPLIAGMRLIRPWCLVRIGTLIGSRIGHFAANTELYLCERDAKINARSGRQVDLFYIEGPVCNAQLARMWGRVLHLLPKWLLKSAAAGNRLLPGGLEHEVPSPHQNDRDVHNLLDRYRPHFTFTAGESEQGAQRLLAMGIPADARFVCLMVRDSAYLDRNQPGDWSYHDYRDSDIRNYALVAETLADFGYFVLRMGAEVKQSMPSQHPRVLDYARSENRSEFMDVFLGACCTFCITTGTGWDSIVEMQRRPMVYVNLVPFGQLHAFRNDQITITKRHILDKDESPLTLFEIFDKGVGFSMKSAEYLSNGVRLVENSPEEICEVSIEMHERLTGSWISTSEDEHLQKRFWEIFPVHATDVYQGRRLHGEIRGRVGAAFLRSLPSFIENSDPRSAPTVLAERASQHARTSGRQ